MRSKPQLLIVFLFFLLVSNSSFSQANASVIQKRWVAVDVVGNTAKKEKYKAIFAKHTSEMEFRKGKFLSYQDGVLQGTATYTMANDGRSLVVEEDGRAQISLKIISLNATTLQAVASGFMSSKDTVIYKVYSPELVKKLGSNKTGTIWAEIEKGWYDVKNRYQRYTDLAINLANMMKGSEGLDQALVTNVVTTRAKVTALSFTPDQLTAENIKQFQDATSQFSRAVNDLMDAADKHEKLKSTQSYRSAIEQVEGLENNIRVARAEYNTAVAKYNAAATANKMKTKDIAFKADPGASEAPKVSF